MATSISVLTLVRDRQRHLDNLILGLIEQRTPPAELIVASMQPDAPRVPEQAPFPIRVVAISGDALPLAAARNRAAASARGEQLVFLDVDCIPSPTLVQSYGAQLTDSNQCAMGEVRYLPSVDYPVTKLFESLLPYARHHPARPAIPDIGSCIQPHHRCLWGLSFALRRSTFEQVGGFDERYIGYGGEETDFAERLHQRGVPLMWCARAMALHQQHAVYSPPLKFFDDIVANARLFFDNWGSWCMEYWLEQFATMGLIEWQMNSNKLQVLRRPDDREIAQALKPPSALWG